MLIFIFSKSVSIHVTGHQRRMPLWLFLIAVIKADITEMCLAWTDRERYQFTVTNTTFLADVWGSLKENCSMDYAKLSRAMRYYYGKGLIEKVRKHQTHNDLCI